MEKNEGADEFREWWERHQHQCHLDFEGSSGTMDAAGCVPIFSRSVEQYGFRYTEFLAIRTAKHSININRGRCV